jgi:BirA family biotin operon repressor/biotin-[acetyl-CoA-carboxylase] ligase
LALIPTENPIGSRFTELDRTESTNSLARQWIEGAFAIHGDVIFAWEQTQGRGQMGKTWASEPGKNLALTILLENARLPDTLPFHLSLCASLAALENLTKITQSDTSLKWPNDLYWKNRKLGGMLLETTTAWSILGIGINVNQTAFPEMRNHPVSLRQITGKTHDPKTLSLQIISSMNQQLERWKERGISNLLEKYRTHLFGKTEFFNVRENGIEKSIQIVDVSDSGALVVEEEGKRKSIVSGLEWIIPA